MECLQAVVVDGEVFFSGTLRGGEALEPPAGRRVEVALPDLTRATVIYNGTRVGPLGKLNAGSRRPCGAPGFGGRRNGWMAGISHTSKSMAAPGIVIGETGEPGHRQRPPLHDILLSRKSASGDGASALRTALTS